MKNIAYFLASLCFLTVSLVQELHAQCPINEADFADGGTFSGPCTEDYGGDVTITGAVIWTGGTFDFRDMDGGGLIIASGGSLTIQGGTFTINDDDGGNDGFITVQSGGTLTMTGGTLNIEEDLNIAGTVDIQSGATINTTEGGDIDVFSGGILTVSGTFNSNDDMTVDAGGTVNINSGGTLDINDNINLDGTITNNGDIIADDIFTSVGSLFDVNAGSTVDVNDNIEVSGTMNISGDVDTGTDFEIDGGYVTVANGGTLDAGDDIQVYGGGTLEIQAGGSAAAVDNVVNNDAGGGGGTTSQGTIIVDGSLDVGDNLTIQDSSPDSGLSGSGTVDVGGTFDDQEGGSFSSCPSFPCSGSFIVEIQDAPGSTFNAFDVTFQFGQDVTGFVIGDITVGNGTASNFASVDANTYTATITPDATGDITIDVAANVVNETNFAAVQVTVIFGLGPGDVMFVGYSSESDNPVNTLGDGMAFVALVDIPASQVIFFTDNEWDRAGESWINDNTSSTDTYYTWTNDASVLPAGSVVYFYGTASQTFTTVGGGSTTSEAQQEIGNVGNTNEVMYMYTANSFNNPASTVFLSALATDGFDDFGGGTTFDRGDLPSSLTIGTNAIEFLDDEELTIYNGPTDCSGTLLQCQQTIADPTNWVTDVNPTQGSGGGTASWPPTDGPIGSGTGFSGSALPVVWLSFEGTYLENERMVRLDWQTASELNNEGFYIERSIDGEQFESLGFVEGHGTIDEMQSYSFVDLTIESSSYYRLLQVDFDGKFEYSNWIFVSLVNPADQKALFVYPNPTEGRFKIGGAVNEIYDITVTSLSGEVISNLKGYNLREAEERINYKLQTYPSGMYIIQFHNPGLRRTISLIKR